VGDKTDVPSDQTLLRLPSESTEAPVARRILVGSGPTVVTHFLPARGPLLVGRSSEAAIHIDDFSVSRLHARLHIGADVRIEDLGSANGTRIGTRRLQVGEQVALSPGQTAELGTAWIMLTNPAMIAAEPRVRGTPREPAAAPAEASSLAGPTALVISDGNIRALHALVERVAPSDIAVLLYGETGVGKEVFARRIHQLSPRAGKPFVGLNCAALSDSLLESELFGYERGAFTGAVQTKPGLLETAEGGTVLLDEIGEVTLAIQVKLLRVLEERQVMRLGSTRPRPIDVRVISATNRNLEAATESGAFRRDLYFRLNGITLEIPPLRQRQEEIEPLARAFLARAAERAGLAASVVVDPGVWDRLRQYRWPGNIRQLRNEMERALVLANGGTVTLDHLPLDTYIGPHLGLGQQAPEPRGPVPRPDSVTRHKLDDDLERARVVQALEACAGNQTRAAELLGVSRRTLVKRLGALNLPRPRKR
jgi:transcriptional regulator with PAS, ATPase and Fis domain